MAMQTIVFVYQGSAIRRRRGALHVQKRGGGLALTRDNQLLNLEDARERKRHAAPCATFHAVVTERPPRGTWCLLRHCCLGWVGATAVDCTGG